MTAPKRQTPGTTGRIMEKRWIGIGNLSGRVVVIAFVSRGPDTIRIVSMRKALKHERARYEEAIKN